MKLINLVKELQAQGVDIKYRVRKDGGILITQVSGMRFTAAEGNRFVRKMTGETLSEDQLKQREKIKPPKKISPARRKKPPIPENVKKQIQKLQRLYRKDKKRGKPTISNYRYNVEHYGEEEANRLLKQSEYYVKGIAYTENIEALIMRLLQVKNTVSISGEDATPIQELVDATKNYAKNYRDKFTEEKLQWLLQVIYDFETEWNKFQSGTSSSYSNSGQIISNFVQAYITTLNA